MRFLLAFGQYAVAVEYPPRLTGALPASWQHYAGAQADPDCVLSLEEMDPAHYGALAHGWHVQSAGGLREAVYALDGKAAFALRYGESRREITVLGCRTITNSVRLGLQFGTMLGLSQECIGLHGVTLLCRDELVILSAPSGTGKTTLSRLLTEHCGAMVINGDFALLSCSRDGVIFEPTLFCGSSGRCLNHRVRINRLVFLEQSRTNQWQTLSARAAMVRFLSNAFLPFWDTEAQASVQQHVLEALQLLKTNAFAFAPNPEAAELFADQLNDGASAPIIH